MIKTFSVVVCILLSSTSVLCQDIKLPQPAGWVSDFAGVISPEYAERISAIIKELEEKTTAEIAVVVIKDIGDARIEEYAVKLFEKWGIGKKGKDNGILILAVMEQRQVRIEVGYGLEPIIPDGVAGSIIREKIIPAFKKGEYGEGMLYATASIASIIARDAGIELDSLKGIQEGVQEACTGEQEPVNFITVVIFVILFLFFFSSLLRGFFFPFFWGGFWRSGRGGFGGFGGFGGGNFGGFGGGMSGGGGATGRW